MGVRWTANGGKVDSQKLPNFTKKSIKQGFLKKGGQQKCHFLKTINTKKFLFDKNRKKKVYFLKSLQKVLSTAVHLSTFELKFYHYFFKKSLEIAKKKRWTVFLISVHRCPPAVHLSTFLSKNRLVLSTKSQKK